MDLWPALQLTIRGPRKKDRKKEKLLTDQCSSRLASACLYSPSSRSRGRACAAGACRLSQWCSWQECLLRRGGSSSVPEKRRRTTKWAAGRDSPWPCAATERRQQIQIMRSVKEDGGYVIIQKCWNHCKASMKDKWTLMSRSHVHYNLVFLHF